MMRSPQAGLLWLWFCPALKHNIASQDKGSLC